VLGIMRFRRPDGDLGDLVLEDSEGLGLVGLGRYWEESLILGTVLGRARD
jgi:hypothetical protein